MREWTPEQWTAIITTAISALTAAFVAVWNAIHGQAISAQICRHELQARHRHEAIVGALTEPPEGEEGVGA